MPFAFHGARHIADRVAAGILGALSVVLLTVSLGYGVADGDRPGPGLYPAIVSAGLIAVAVAWLVTGAGREPERAAEPVIDGEHVGIPTEVQTTDDEDVLDEQPIGRAGTWRILFVVAWALVPLFLLDTIGYLLSMTTYIGGLLLVIGRSRAWIALPATALGVLGTAYGADMLGIVLPDPLGIIQLLGL
jgi:hypothetical protein